LIIIKGFRSVGVRSQESGVRSQESGVRSQDKEGRRKDKEGRINIVFSNDQELS
jgi:hypothetical protein